MACKLVEINPTMTPIWSRTVSCEQVIPVTLSVAMVKDYVPRCSPRATSHRADPSAQRIDDEMESRGRD